jgi:hypothetical protein
MRGWILLLLFAAVALPARAAQRVTVAELQQFLAAQYAAHKSDSSIAEHLGNMELSEQLTGPTLDRITVDLKLEKKATQALQLLADQSAFLDPPAGEIPANAAPGRAEQLRLLQGAVDFASVTFKGLPDFMATRSTHTFDNSSLVMTTDASRVGIAARGALHANGEYTRQITFRGGAEVSVDQADGQDKQDKHGAMPPGLTSYGEFGPFLVTVLSDIAGGKLAWSRWEQTRNGMAAVFKYDVPEQASHYSVDYCCVLFVPLLTSGGGRQTTKEANTPSNFHSTPAYHGYLYLDPQTGAVLRVAMEAEMKSDDPLVRVAQWVGYGPVEIGERNYLCPVRASALTMVRAWREGEPGMVWLNEVTFTNYHRFGSTAHILSATPEP